MASEKAIYWTAGGVLALAVTNGFVGEYREWAGRLADKSMAKQASEIAAGYATWGAPDRNSDDLKRLVRAQIRLARVRSTFARRQVEMARVQVEGIGAPGNGTWYSYRRRLPTSELGH